MAQSRRGSTGRESRSRGYHSPAYLSRNRHSYCFRVRIPEDVRKFFGKKELRYTLGTGYIGKAKLEARRLAGIVQRLIHDLRNSSDCGIMDSLTDQEIQKLVTEYLEKIKAGYDNPVDPQSDNLPFHDEESFRDYLATLDDIKSDLCFQVASGNYEHVEQEARALLREILPDTGEGAHAPLFKAQKHGL